MRCGAERVALGALFERPSQMAERPIRNPRAIKR